MLPGQNWAGAIQFGPGDWTGVSGIVNIPLFSNPSGNPPDNQTASLTPWVGIDGWGSSESYLFQTVLISGLNASPTQPIAEYVPQCQWYLPDPEDSLASIAHFLDVTNPPPLIPGFMVQLYCGYGRVLTGLRARLRFVSFTFWELGVSGDIITNVPVVMSFSFLAPIAPASCIEWVLENGGITDNDPTQIVPAFQPIEFQQATGTTGGATGILGIQDTAGNPASGDELNWTNTAGQPVPGTSVTIGQNTVKFAYDE